MGRHKLTPEGRRLCGKDMEWLRVEYHQKKRTLKDIANELGCSRQAVSGFFKIVGLQAREMSYYREIDPKDIVTLREKGYTDDKIAEHLNCCKGLVGQRRREAGLVAVTKMKLQILKNKGWLYKKYVTEKLSQKRIAKLLGVVYATIYRYLKIHGISRKKKGSYLNSPYDNKIRYPLLHDVGWLRKTADQNTTIVKIAQEINSSYSAVYNAILKNNLLDKVRERCKKGV